MIIPQTLLCLFEMVVAGARVWYVSYLHAASFSKIKCLRRGQSRGMRVEEGGSGT